MPEPVTVLEMKDWLRDGEADDTLVTALGVAAREFIETATGQDFSSAEAVVPERAKVAIKMLVAHWYENRVPVEIAVTATPVLPLHVKALVHQLANWTDPSLIEEATA